VISNPKARTGLRRALFALKSVGLLVAEKLHLGNFNSSGGQGENLRLLEVGEVGDGFHGRCALGHVRSCANQCSPAAVMRQKNRL